MRAEAVRAWRDALWADRRAAPDTVLSAPGRELVLRLALDALDDASLEEAACAPGAPWPRATFIAARTVVTAPLEWIALLLLAGTTVRWKAPAAAPGLSAWAAAHARAVDLPLTATTERPTPHADDLVIAMGSDETVAALQHQGHPHLLGFGHRFSAAWWGCSGAPDPIAAAVARDLAAHDSRGCMSPAVLFTDEDPSMVAEALATAMETAEARWPRGRLAPAEHAALRTRIALARAVGGEVRRDDAWSVLTVPLSMVRPSALPRSIQVVHTSRQGAEQWLATQDHPVSTFGATSPDGWTLGDARVCALGTMQAPPLLRVHDGVDLVAATRQPAPAGRG